MGFTVVQPSTPAIAAPSAPAYDPSTPIAPFLHHYDREPFRLQLLGLTGSGKTTLVGEIADYLWMERRQRTLYHRIDRGSPRSIQGLIDRNIIIDHQRRDHDPFIWINKCAEGSILNAANQWIPIPPELNIGLVVFDSATGLGDDSRDAVRESHAAGSGIGTAVQKDHIRGREDEGTITHVRLDKTHWGIVQDRIRLAMWRSQGLPYHLIWTAALRRVEDDEMKAPVLGADLSGKALGSESPRWFMYTWVITVDSNLNQPNRHILHLAPHVNQHMGNTQIVGNPRLPLTGQTVTVPTSIEPASLVRAFSVIGSRQTAAEVDMDQRFKLTDDERSIRARLGI